MACNVLCILKILSLLQHIFVQNIFFEDCTIFLNLIYSKAKAITEPVFSFASRNDFHIFIPLFMKERLYI